MTNDDEIAKLRKEIETLETIDINTESFDQSFQNYLDQILPYYEIEGTSLAPSEILQKCRPDEYLAGKIDFLSISIQGKKSQLDDLLTGDQ